MNDSVDQLPVASGSSPELAEIPFELASLANAVNYQRWVFRTVAPFIGNRVLEIGAGIGNMSKWLPGRERLILTETDPNLIKILSMSMTSSGTSHDPGVSVSSFDLLTDDLTPFLNENLDTVISFNVLEHIENDELALERLCQLVRNTKSNGPRRVVTFVPAHSWAYGNMDKSFGHYRRYSKKALRRLCEKIAPDARLTFRHFNLLGLAGWYWNGRVLGKHRIGVEAVEIFETICPFVSGIDDFLHTKLNLPLGQSLLAVLEWP